MFITLKSQHKPVVDVVLGSVGSDAGTGDSVWGQLEWQLVRCGSCHFGARFEHCAAVRSCADIFCYFCDTVSYGPAEAELVSGQERLKFSGSAQCVAAFAILACMVYSHCGRAAPYSFLLEHFCKVQGQAADPAFFENTLGRRDRQAAGGALEPDRESWHELFDTLLRRKVVSVLGVYDNGGLNDTLRNACQILYSISSLALDEMHTGRGVPAGPGFI